MLSICTIGIGNAGNQIADLAMGRYQIPGIAINSSQKDLVNIKNIPKVIVGDEKGAGKDRSEAKKFIKMHIKALLDQEKFTGLIEAADVIFIISSIGGGTGSGMSPIMTDILSRRFRSKKFVLIEVYPPITESLAAQQNSIDYLKEVKSFLPNAVYIAYDNNRYSDLPTPDMMQTVNNEIVEALAILRGEYLYTTPYNSIDEKDLLRFFETPGRMAVYMIENIKEKDFDNKTLETALIDNIKNISANVELDRDKIVKRLGAITNLNPVLNKLFDTNLTTIKELIGEPVEAYEHTYIASMDEMNRLILILAGLSEPEDRLKKILQRIEEGLEELSRKKESSILDELDTNVIRDLRSAIERANDEFDLEDIFDKYDG